MTDYHQPDIFLQRLTGVSIQLTELKQRLFTELAAENTLQKNFLTLLNYYRTSTQILGEFDLTDERVEDMLEAEGYAFIMGLVLNITVMSTGALDIVSLQNTLLSIQNGTTQFSLYRHGQVESKLEQKKDECIELLERAFLNH